jgi:Ca2+-binding EF-hand superfamily protein
MYQRLDTNGDGKISKEEWRGRAEGFAKLDTNGDGFLTLRRCRLLGFSATDLRGEDRE